MDSPWLNGKAVSATTIDLPIIGTRRRQRPSLFKRSILIAALISSAQAIAHAPSPATVDSVSIPSLTLAADESLQTANPADLDIRITDFTREVGLVKREPRPEKEDSGGTESSKEPSSTSLDKHTGKSPSKTAEASKSDKPAEATSTPSPLPEPFDGISYSDFKTSGEDDSCPIFMRDLLNNPTFKKCYPVSMMLQQSTSFFQAEKQLLSIVRVLDAACASDIDVNECDDFLGGAAKNLTSSSNCKAEYDANQELVTLAYSMLRAYKVVQASTCLQNPETDTYCFASAITNVTNPTDVFFYFMPLGSPLPGGSTPSCGWCTSQTMAIFHASSSNRRQAISEVYEGAAQQVNTICGPKFVNNTLPAESLAIMNLAPPTSRILTTAASAALLILGMAWL